MRAWVADRFCETVIFIIFVLCAGGAWLAYGLVPIVLWFLLSAIAAPIIGRAMSCDEAFDVDLCDEPPRTSHEEEQCQ